MPAQKVEGLMIELDEADRPAGDYRRGIRFNRSDPKGAGVMDALD